MQTSKNIPNRSDPDFRDIQNIPDQRGSGSQYFNLGYLYVYMISTFFLNLLLQIRCIYIINIHCIWYPIMASIYVYPEYMKFGDFVYMYISIYNIERSKTDFFPILLG